MLAEAVKNQLLDNSPVLEATPVVQERRVVLTANLQKTRNVIPDPIPLFPPDVDPALDTSQRNGGVDTITGLNVTHPTTESPFNVTQRGEYLIPDLPATHPAAGFVNIVFPILNPPRGRPLKSAVDSPKTQADLPSPMRQLISKIPLLYGRGRIEFKTHLGLPTLKELYHNVPSSASPIEDIPIPEHVKRIFLFIYTIAKGRFSSFDPDLTYATADDFKRAVGIVGLLASRKPEGQQNALAVYDDINQQARMEIFNLLMRTFSSSSPTADATQANGLDVSSEARKNSLSETPQEPTKTNNTPAEREVQLSVLHEALLMNGKAPAIDEPAIRLSRITYLDEPPFIISESERNTEREKMKKQLMLPPGQFITNHEKVLKTLLTLEENTYITKSDLARIFYGANIALGNMTLEWARYIMGPYLTHAKQAAEKVGLTILNPVPRSFSIRDRNKIEARYALILAEDSARKKAEWMRNHEAIR